MPFRPSRHPDSARGRGSLAGGAHSLSFHSYRFIDLVDHRKEHYWYCSYILYAPLLRNIRTSPNSAEDLNHYHVDLDSSGRLSKNCLASKFYERASGEQMTASDGLLLNNILQT